MSIKSIADTYEEILSKESAENAYADADLRNKLTGNMKEFERFAKLAQDVVLERISEKDFVRFMLMVQRAVSAMIITEGREGLLLAELEGSLQGYTHTVALAIIGALIEDEVL